jgi:hypothetical protein
MKSNWIMLVLCACWELSALAGPESPTIDRSAAVNAAPIYWQAFAAMPVFTPEEQKRIDNSLGGREVNVSEVSPLIDRSAESLKQMQRAARLEECDWELDYSEGPNMLLSHLGKGRELMKLALLRARLRLQKGDAGGAVDDIVATVRMARHLGSSPHLISMLVDNAVERAAIELSAENLAAFDRAALDRLGKALAGLPAAPTLADRIAAERAAKLSWFDLGAQAQDTDDNAKVGGRLQWLLPGDDDRSKQMRAQVEALSIGELKAARARLGDDFAELQQIVNLPNYAERREKAGRFFADLSKSAAGKAPADRERLFSTWAIPVYQRMIDLEEQRRVRRELLSLAILVQSQGPGALESVTVPDKDKLQYHRTEKGFELRYDLSPAVKPEVLTVGLTGE